MRWFRQTLKRGRVFILSLVLVETFFPAAAEEPLEEKPAERRLVPMPSGEKQRSGPARHLLEGKSLPLQRVERKAGTEEDRAADPQAKSSARAPASVPRRAVSKSGLAPEITALAESLGSSPGRIFRFVHDTIDFEPRWGAGKPPLGTLWEGTGTSWDQAWLLRDLLTAVGVDARFEWGEVEMTVEMLKNVTGVDDPFRAGDLLATAGVPIVLVVNGSQVVGARMSHVWIKAHLDYIPNRGVTPGPGDTWIRMDPSLKRFDVAGGLRLDEEVAFDLGEYLQSGTVFAPRRVYEEALQAYIDAHSLGVGLEELKRSKDLLEEAFPFVPGTLRGKILSVAGESTEMPEAFQQQLDLQVREADGPVLVSWSTPWPAVYGQRLELAWPGATAADQATLDLYGGVFATPPYEVDLKPVLRVDGVEVAAGGAIGSAEDVVLLATITPPQGSETVVQFEMLAGEHAVFAVDFARIAQEVIDRYTTERSAATDSSEEEEAWTLALASALYLRGLAGDLEHLGALRWRRVVKLGNVVLAVQRGGVSRAPDGTPLTFSPAPPSIELGSMALGLFPPDGVAPTAAAAVGTLELLGSQSSFLEGETWYEVIGGEQVTAVSFLTRAVREGQTLTRVEAGNLDAALAAAELSDRAEAGVRAGVERGLIAWISESQLPVDTWDTTGYVLEDPETGAAGYFVTFERLVPGLEALIEFHSPQDLDVVTAPIDVVATLDGEEIESWILGYQFAGEGQPVVLATGTGPLTNATLAQFDPTLLLNGLYDIVLTARNAAGQTASETISVVVEGQMKIGHFTLSFVDLAVPVSGLDIEVVRTYDSRDQRQGDFGVGWTLDIRQGSYRNNRPPGDGWEFQTGFLPCDTTIERKSHSTVVRLSDREVYRFALRLLGAVPELGGCVARARFDYVDGPLPGTTLEILGNDLVFWENAGDRVIDQDTLEVFEPRDVRLTTRDGRIFELDLVNGVELAEDLSGNRLTITPAGITHSSGKGIVFERDTEGRIVEIRDPLGNPTTYGYDAPGDLIAVTDRVGSTVRFAYDGDHRLEDIQDPRGILPIRNDYDESGRLIRTTDAFGKSLSLEHDLDAHREVVTNRLGASRVLEYDGRGNVTRETDELGEVTVRTFDGEDNLLAETDPLERTTTFTYTPSNDLETQADPLGKITTFAYNSRGQVTSATDPKGNVTTSAYDTRGNLTRTINALEQETAFTYDTAGNLRTTTDSQGHVTTFEYDSFGNQKKAIDALGNETVSTYDANGKRLTNTRVRTLRDGTTSQALTTTFVYDELDRLTSTIAPDGTSSTTVYDVLGAVESRTDELGRMTTMSYDLMGRLIRTEYPDETSTTQTYDAEGRLLTLSDRGGRTTAVTYDAAGRLLTTISPDLSTTSNTYDDAGQLVAATDARENNTTFTYDAAGRRTAVIDPLGNGKTFAYDDNGNQTSVTDALGHTTAFAYDALNRPLTTTFPDTTTTHVGYDGLGRRVTETDQAGRVTTFGYDALGRLTSVNDALDQVTSFSYDEVGNRLTQTDANGHTTRYEYDSLGRRTARVLPDGARETMAYHADGTLASHTDFNGAVRTFEYDADRRLIRRAYPGDSEVTFTYTSSGRRATVTDSRGTTSFTYDNRDRLTEKTDPTGYKLGYTYDPQNNRTSLTVTVGTEVLATTYAYDAVNRLTTLSDSQGEVTTLGYDSQGNRSSLALPNDVTTNYTYDELNRLTELRSETSIWEVLQSYAYTLSPAGHRTRIDERDGTSRHYRYDALYRLTQDRVTGPAGALIYQRDFTYDPVGNRLSQAVDEGGGPTTLASVYDTTDRLLSADSTTYGWDANGNVTSRTNSGGTTYGWDHENRLTSVTLDDGTLVETTYDVDGNRVRRAATPPGGPTTAVDYLVDTAGLLSHVVADVVDGSVQTLYTRAADQLISLYRPAPGIQRYYHTDGLGSVRLLSDEAGAATDHYVYSAFGELLDLAGSDPSPYRFTGEPLDSSLNWYYLRARWMDPAVGRFAGVDPFEGLERRPLTLHRYSYAEGNPLNMIDPQGLFAGLVSLNMTIDFMVSQIMKADWPGAFTPLKDKSIHSVSILPVFVGDTPGDLITWLVQIGVAQSVFSRAGVNVQLDSRTERMPESRVAASANGVSLADAMNYAVSRYLTSDHPRSTVPVVYIDDPLERKFFPDADGLANLPCGNLNSVRGAWGLSLASPAIDYEQKLLAHELAHTFSCFGEIENRLGGLMNGKIQSLQINLENRRVLHRNVGDMLKGKVPEVAAFKPFGPS